MLTHPTVDKLHQLRCAGMAKLKFPVRDKAQLID